MYRYKIKIANIVIEIETVHVLPYSISRKFLTDEPAILSIRSTQKDIEQNKAEYEDVNGLSASWDGEVETVVVLRKIAEGIINYGAFLMHGAAIAIENSALIFTANSGVGKTTHILKWLHEVPDAFVINGDKPFILTGETPYVCSSPWSGKENLYTNTMVPLKAIILLERSEDNAIFPISFSEAFPMLFQQIHRPEDIEIMRKELSLLKSLNQKVKFYRFKMNNMKDDCFQVVYNAIMEK